jgi:CheY-specific phosphatase CheX
MAETSNNLLLQNLMTACTVEFFESRGVPLRPVSAPTAAIERAAAIGFSSKEMRGVVGIGMETSTLHAIVAAQPLLTEKVSRDDWLGEAANQLLGRFKNKLIAHGAIVSIALPMVLRGIRMQFISIGAEGLWTYAAESDRGQVYVWLDVRMADGLVLARSEDPDAQSAAEGELVLF